jgi:hypothetical protein
VAITRIFAIHEDEKTIDIEAITAVIVGELKIGIRVGIISIADFGKLIGNRSRTSHMPSDDFMLLDDEALHFTVLPRKVIEF